MSEYGEKKRRAQQEAVLWLVPERVGVEREGEEYEAERFLPRAAGGEDEGAGEGEDEGGCEGALGGVPVLAEDEEEEGDGDGAEEGGEELE